MGREIRQVIPNWDHPRRRCEHSPWMGGCDEAKRNNGQCYQPMYDQDYDAAAREWLRDCIAHSKKKHTDPESKYYWDYSGPPPDKAFYRPKWSDHERTWVQIYETVSEGTPVTPPFATKAELVEYLVQHGDFWDQLRGNGGWSRANAERFVEDEFAPSMMVMQTSAGMVIKEPRDGA